MVPRPGSASILAQIGSFVSGKAPSIVPSAWTVVSPMPTAQDESFSGSARNATASVVGRSTSTEQMWARAVVHGYVFPASEGGGERHHRRVAFARAKTWTPSARAPLEARRSSLAPARGPYS